MARRRHGQERAIRKKHGVASLPSQSAASQSTKPSSHTENSVSLPGQRRVGSTTACCFRNDCLAYELCQTVEAGSNLDTSQDAADGRCEPHGQIRTVPARETIFYSRDLYGYVPVICDGWATHSLVLPDGRRQILSFLLPGDLISNPWHEEATSGHIVQTVTPVAYRKFKRSMLESMLSNDPELRKKHWGIWNNELVRIQELALSLGRRNGTQRIARLLLALFCRLSKLDKVQDGRMEFPLRQRDIADATGLTPDHVSRIFVEFQRAKIIKMDERALAIVKLEELRART